MKIPLTVYGQFGAGRLFTISGDINYYTPKIGFFTGKKNLHLDLNSGFVTLVDLENTGSTSFSPAGYLGFRYQRATKEVTSRYNIGVGFPELLSFGIGTTF